MSDEPRFMKVEMRPFAWVPFCYECGEVRVLKPNLIISDVKPEDTETWICPKCGDEDELPPGFPRIRHEAVSVEHFEMPKMPEEQDA